MSPRRVTVLLVAVSVTTFVLAWLLWSYAFGMRG